MDITYPYDDLHAQDASEVLKALQTNAVTDLNQSEANNRIKKFGANIFEAQKQRVFG